jgi:DNA invertase Pin-like site-specific DNA recombinase
MQDQVIAPAVLYAAKSTQDKRGSNATQLADNEAFAKAEGMAIEGRYADENESAYHGNRGPKLEAALDHAERIGGSLIVQHSDRLARGDGVKARHLVQLVLEARARGIRLRSVEDDSSLESLVMAAVMGERNTEDSRRKGAAVRAGMKRRRERGEYIGQRPFGYQWQRNEEDKRVIVPNPPEAAIVRRIFAEYLAGRSQLGIARGLMHDKVPTLRGKQWHQGTVRHLLASPLYAGWLRSEDELIEGIHEPLIERAEWEKAADLRQAKTRTHGRGRPVAGRHLFRKGFLRCGLCGGSMVPRTNPNRANPPSEVYECYLRRRDVEACSMPPVKRADVDPAVLAYFEQVGLDLEATRVQFSAAMDRKLDEVRTLHDAASREAAAATERVSRVKRDYTNGDLSISEWRELRAELEPEAAAATSEARRLLGQVKAAESDAALKGAEAEVFEQLARIRSAVAGDVVDAAGAEAVRATLLRLFDHFTLNPGIPDRANVELVKSSWWIEPTVSERAIAGYDEQMRPILSREPLGQAKNNYAKGLTRKSSAPVSSPRTLSSSEPWPVRTITGRAGSKREVTPSASRISRNTSSPEASGKERSSSSRSGWL